MIKTIELEHGHFARGRNGKFAARRLELVGPERGPVLNGLYVWSKRTDGDAPIVLDLCNDELIQLRDTINEILEDTP